MTRNNYQLDEMSTVDLAQSLKESKTLVMSAGSTEPHGPHMPLGTDTIQARHLSGKLAERLTQRGQASVAGPPIPFGLLTNQFERSDADAGNVAISASTLIELLLDITRSYARMGFSRFVWLVCHVENEAAMHVAAKQLFDESGIYVIVLNWLQRAADLYPTHLRGNPTQGHAGEGETARMLAIRPDLVDHLELDAHYDSSLSKLQETPHASLSYFGGGVGVFGARTHANSPGYQGEPALATPEAGAALIDQLVDWMADTAVTLCGLFCLTEQKEADERPKP